MKAFYGMVALTLVATSLSAQKLSPLAAPTSPASYALGLQPTAVLSPKSYRALEAALFSGFVNPSSLTPVVPNDFALEFSPYWVKEGRKFSLSDYLYPSWEKALVRSSSFSVASSQNFLLEDKTASNALALGYRTRLYFPTQKDRELIEAYTNTFHTSAGIFTKVQSDATVALSSAAVSNNAGLITLVCTSLQKQLTAVIPALPAKQINEITSQLQAALNQHLPASFDATGATLTYVLGSGFTKDLDAALKLQSSFNTLKDYILKRQGLSVDIALASLLNFPGNSFGLSYVPKTSFWLTPSYQQGALKMMGVFRYEWYHTGYYRRFFPSSTVYENNIDYGLAAESETKKLSLKLELVGKAMQTLVPSGKDAANRTLYIKQSKSDFQCVGSFSYRVTDDLALSYTLGRKFEPLADPLKTLVSLLSVNLGLGGPKKDDVQ